MISPPEFVGMSLGAGAALAFAPELLRAHQQSSGTLIQRAIPSSGEMLPAVGLHFGNPAGPMTGIIMQQGQLTIQASRVR